MFSLDRPLDKQDGDQFPLVDDRTAEESTLAEDRWTRLGQLMDAAKIDERVRQIKAKAMSELKKAAYLLAQREVQ